MHVGVPKEIKDQEYRVSMTPGGVRELVSRNHTVWVEQDAGSEVGFTNDQYLAVGAKVVPTADEVYEKAELIVKVKEPQPDEFSKIRRDHILFTYLHLAAEPSLTDHLLSTGCSAIAYETVTEIYGGLPLLAPMSEVAGRLSVQAGAHCLEKKQGGRGVLLGGVAGAPPANVVILGGGMVGTQALTMAVGLGANVTVVDKSLRRLRELDALFGGRLTTLYPSEEALEEQLIKADLVIGAILIPGAATKKIVSREMLKMMKAGSVVVDIAIDQGGCFESSRPTTHTQPTFIDECVVHFCVTNLPSRVPRTSTIALNNATMPYIYALTEKGFQQACLDDPHLLNGLNVYQGQVTHEAVAQALNKVYQPAKNAIAN